MKNFFKTLFTDKSFWAALVSVVTCICVALNVGSGSIAQITSFIGGLGTIIAYIINNGVQASAQIQANASVESARLNLEAAKEAKVTTYTTNIKA